MKGVVYACVRLQVDLHVNVGMKEGVGREDMQMHAHDNNLKSNQIPLSVSNSIHFKKNLFHRQHIKCSLHGWTICESGRRLLYYNCGIRMCSSHIIWRITTQKKILGRSTYIPTILVGAKAAGKRQPQTAGCYKYWRVCARPRVWAVPPSLQKSNPIRFLKHLDDGRNVWIINVTQ